MKINFPFVCNVADKQREKQIKWQFDIAYLVIFYAGHSVDAIGEKGDEQDHFDAGNDNYLKQVWPLHVSSSADKILLQV